MKDKLRKLLLIVPVVGFLFLVPLLTLISKIPGGPLTPTASYSVWENRTMAVFPQLTAKGFWDGSYFAGWETALSDQFYGRDYWLKAHTRYAMLRCSASVNDVVITEETLLPQQTATDYKGRDLDAEAQDMAQGLAALRDQVEDYGGTFLYVGVPEQRSILEFSYPDWQTTNSEYRQALRDAFVSAMAAEQVPFLEMKPLLEGREDLTDLYSTVDHHYTLLGAYETYLAVCDRLTAAGWDFPVVTEDQITFTALPNPYLGTYNRKLYGQSPVTEPLWVCESPMEVPFTRMDNGEEVEAEVFDLPDSTWQYVYYTSYMGGDQAETILDTGREDLPKVLIWGDSFTNAFESLAWMSFGEIRSIDLRYYTEKSLPQYIDDYRPDIVLCIRDDLSYLVTEGNGNLTL